MVILGLGSNQGHPLTHLRKALQAIRQEDAIALQGVSPVYRSDALLPPGAPRDWDMPYLNAAVAIETRLTPKDLITVTKAIEQQLGRQHGAAQWSPRPVDIDLLAWGDDAFDDEALTLPHRSLLERPFALWPLLDLQPHWVYPGPGPQQGQRACDIAAAWGKRFDGQGPLHTRRIPHRIDTPALVGILNVTPDSFSDGKSDLQAESLRALAVQLTEAGAEVIDIGAESTRPSARALSAEEEWQRLMPVLDALSQHAWPDACLKPLLSIDTYHPETAKRALTYPIAWLNDVGASLPPALLAEHPHCRYVMMRPRSFPCEGEGLDAVRSCLNWGKQRLAILIDAGVHSEQIIFDPGLGFACTATQSMAITQHAAQLQTLDLPVLIGHSRKSFMNTITSRPFADRDIETLAFSLQLAQQGVDYLRVHNVDFHARAFAVL